MSSEQTNSSLLTVPAKSNRDLSPTPTSPHSPVGSTNGSSYLGDHSGFKSSDNEATSAEEDRTHQEASCSLAAESTSGLDHGSDTAAMVSKQSDKPGSLSAFIQELNTLNDHLPAGLLKDTVQRYANSLDDLRGSDANIHTQKKAFLLQINFQLSVDGIEDEKKEDFEYLLHVIPPKSEVFKFFVTN